MKSKVKKIGFLFAFLLIISGNMINSTKAQEKLPTEPKEGEWKQITGIPNPPWPQCNCSICPNITTCYCI
jgi:hypothetical protein